MMHSDRHSSAANQHTPAPVVTPSTQPRPELGVAARKTLDDLHLTHSRDDSTFQHFILGYGIQIVAHAVMFERAALVMAARLDINQFISSLTGPTPFARPHEERTPLICSLKELSKRIYIPPCAFQDPISLSCVQDRPITFLNSDLGNLFYPCSDSTQSRQAFTRAISYLDSCKEPEDIVKRGFIKRGIPFTHHAWDRNISSFITESARTRYHPPLGAMTLILHYEAVVKDCAERTRATLDA